MPRAGLLNIIIPFESGVSFLALQEP